ncbi:MAG: GNAT family N-acetyltransferase [Rhodobacteraceae bacterium]|nr:MAG: GNAT family N-acetyltransferase [Paracoccaceae bacterium]
MTPDAATLLRVCEATWPAARTFDEGPFTFREGRGGGKRVSATTLNQAAPPRDEDRQRAEERMAAMGQPPLFQLRPGEEAFDQQLAAAGYEIVDPTEAHVIETARLTDIPIPRVTTFCIWEPLAIMIDLWAAAGIGPARLAVMERAQCPKTAILGRIEDSPGACAYVGLADGIAMLHALEVTPGKRRKGLARWMVRQAAVWAQSQGATHLAALCTRDNAPAHALYHGLGFEKVGGYHYRRGAT